MNFKALNFWERALNNLKKKSENGIYILLKLESQDVSSIYSPKDFYRTMNL